MKTLIELYDERPLENVLSTEVFRPEHTVFICPPAVAENARLQGQLRRFFAHRGLDTRCSFVKTRLLDAGSVERSLRQITAENEDCALDIAGGTDAALFAAGVLCTEKRIPVFTYSRRRNTFYEIMNAPFAHNLPCNVHFSVEDCFMMAGGSMRTGRVDNAILDRYLPLIDPMFALYLRYRRDWQRIVTYMQRISQRETSGTGLEVQGAYTVKSERGGRVSAHEEALRAMEAIGLLQGVSICPERGVTFTFRDEQIRTWLRDVGSVLELYVYKACRDLRMFDDVRTSAIVDWQEGIHAAERVSNELDVMATAGVKPIFISCKTCDVKTEALNELAVLRDRFGGQIARAAIVTAENGRPPMRRRAMELGIDVIDLNDLKMNHISSCLKALLRE